ncbi:MAG: membrane protein insertion efficiency factor YidD [Leptospiraceae bacterium]|nr:membrane protein insertion efficiency factor YidD [Leptospiraceae bacterium]
MSSNLNKNSYPKSLFLPLKSRRGIAELFKHGHKIYAQEIMARVILPQSANEETWQVVFTLPRGFGNAVNRNRARRQLRASLFRSLTWLMQSIGKVPQRSVHIALIPRKSFFDLPQSIRQQNLNSLVEKIFQWEIKLSSKENQTKPDRGPKFTNVPEVPAAQVLRRDLKRRTGVFREAFLTLIRLYRWLLSPLIGRQCRFYPTCSHYALDVFTYLPLHSAFYLSSKRILRCHPGTEGGEDYPPGLYTSQSLQNIDN